MSRCLAWSHARNVRPPLVGDRIRRVDESSVRDLPGFVQVVRKGNYLAVVCEREEQAINAARRLTVDWEKPQAAPFPTSGGLFAYMRSATPTSSAAPNIVGDPDAGFGGAATIIEAAYDYPFQGHTALGPAHAVADPSNGQMTIYSNDMKSYRMRTEVAQFLGMPRERVRVVWMEGPQAFGPTAADDAGFEAAFIARAGGRFACSGCGMRKPRGTRRVQPSPSGSGEDWMPLGSSSHSTTMRNLPTTITSATTRLGRC